MFRPRKGRLLRNIAGVLVLGALAVLNPDIGYAIRVVTVVFALVHTVYVGAAMTRRVEIVDGSMDVYTCGRRRSHPLRRVAIQFQEVLGGLGKSNFVVHIRMDGKRRQSIPLLGFSEEVVHDLRDALSTARSS